MIKLTKLNGKEFFLNAEMVEIIEELPDTVITLTNHDKFMVKESADEVVKRIIDYSKSVKNIISFDR